MEKLAHGWLCFVSLKCGQTSLYYNILGVGVQKNGKIKQETYGGRRGQRITSYGARQQNLQQKAVPKYRKI